jgi:hypothetical protein
MCTDSGLKLNRGACETTTYPNSPAAMRSVRQRRGRSASTQSFRVPPFYDRPRQRPTAAAYQHEFVGTNLPGGWGEVQNPTRLGFEQAVDRSRVPIGMGYPRTPIAEILRDAAASDCLMAGKTQHEHLPECFQVGDCEGGAARIARGANARAASRYGATVAVFPKNFGQLESHCLS